MSKYADVYLCPIAEENVPAYKRMAAKVGKIFLKHGATKYREYIASDLNADEVVAFPQAVKLKPGETLIYAAVEFRSEAARNKAMKAIMADPAMAALCSPDDKQLFDYKRMVYGGFKVLVDL